MIKKQINFDIKSYLDSKGIRYFTSGKNTIKGAISTRCPFHNDSSNHLNLWDDGWCKCWHCGSIRIEKYLKEIEGDWRSAYDVLKQHSIEFIEDQEDREEEEIDHPNTFNFPKEFSHNFPKKYREYLEDRNFDWRKLRSKYNLLTSGNIGKHKFRIIFPIIIDERIVSFVGRDITEKQGLKYLNYPDELSVLPRKEWVFNIDSIKTNACIICEGILDAIRIGDGAVSFLTTNFTTNQILRLKKKGVRNFYICYDNDDAGRSTSEKLEAALGWADTVNYIDLPEGVGDPAELSEEEVMELRRMVF